MRRSKANNNESGTNAKEKEKDDRIEQTGQLLLDENKQKEHLHLVTIIGEIEGHDVLGNNAKTTKYEHILPGLAAIEDSQEIEGVLVLLNTISYNLRNL